MITIFIFCLFILNCLVTFFLFDRIVKHEFNHHYQQWIKDGYPIGFFWFPKTKDVSKLNLFLLGSTSRSRYSLLWIVKPPYWAKTDIEIRKKIFIFRLSGTTCVLIWFLWVFVIFI